MTEYSALIEAEGQPLTFHDDDAVDKFVDWMTRYHGCCAFSQDTAPVPSYSARFTVEAEDAAVASEVACDVFRSAVQDTSMMPATIGVVEVQTMASLDAHTRRTEQ